MSPVIIVLSIFGLLTVVAMINHARTKSYLMKEIKVDKKTLENVKSKVGIEPAAAVGITIFDVLYNTSKMDPFVLKGIDHLHHSQNFENLSDISAYLKDNIINSEDGSTAWRQMIHKYKGYTGEEYTFDKLDQKGIDYIKPESGTNEQYDAIIDGKKVDIAITDDPRYIAEKLEDPDVFVYTNKEMAAAYENNPRVIIDNDLSVEEMFETTDSTFSGLDDLGDFIDGIPLVTALISGVKNTKGVIDGNKNIGTALEHTASDVIGVGVGGWAGAKVGLAVGLSLAPVTGGISAIIGPIIGSIGGVFGGRSISKWFKERNLRKAKEALESVAAEYKRLFLSKYNQIISSIEKTYIRNKDRSDYSYKNSQSLFGRIFFPKILTKFYSLASKEFSRELKKTKAFYSELKNKVEISSDYDGGMILYSQGVSILAGDQELINLNKHFTEKIDWVQIEIKKLS